MDANGVWYSLMGRQNVPSQSPRILVIGAGSRGNGYAREIDNFTNGIVAAVAEPVEAKRKAFGSRYVWKKESPKEGQEFSGWREFLDYELSRRERAAAGEDVPEGVDAAFICTLEKHHVEAITAMAPLRLHIMSEKPLATTLEDCLRIYAALKSDALEPNQQVLFGIGHVLRYSPHNMMLRKLLLEDNVIGEVLSMEHTEPVGHWHFSHSYVRGNWRRESSTGPSLLTKSCHDMDFILWFMCQSPQEPSGLSPHLPSKISSSGALNFFRKSRKPRKAGTATNCLSCPHESSCIYSAKRIYLDRRFRAGHLGWPVKIVAPEIEECYLDKGLEAAENMLLHALTEDYNKEAITTEELEKRSWYGRCVWEADNDVCDDQWVTFSWDEEEASSANTLSREHSDSQSSSHSRPAKTATFHMVAQTEAMCARRGIIYGELGEISYDSNVIQVYDFASRAKKPYRPQGWGGRGHGGGDTGLVQQFVRAVENVKSKTMTVEKAQRKFIGCDLDEVLRSHAAVFVAEEARKEGRTVEWKEWWSREVESWHLV